MTHVPTLARTQVDLTGLMRLLANSLYSSPEVVIRELVQNAHDSCVRRQLEDPGAFEPSVRVTADPVAGTLSIEDTGAGLTREEIDRFLATVGAGYTGQLRRAGKGDQLIGQFGIGFLSAYAVSDAVDLYTTSYKTPEETWHFFSAGGERYSVEPSDERPVGTRVVLHVVDRFSFLADSARVEALLRHYCCLLSVPLFLGAARINDAPPWRDADLSPLRRKKLSLEFATKFEHDFAPLCTMPVHPRNGGSAHGLLWIQDGGSYATSDNRHVSVFVRGMLVTSDGKELLPSWAGFVGGVLEADELSPTASREDVQKDAAFAATAAQVRDVLVEQLATLAREEPAVWRRVLLRHNEALLGAALCEPRLFSLLADVLTVPTTAGDLTVPAIRNRSKGSVHVTLSDAAGAEELLFGALGVPVALGTRYAVLPFVTLHRKGQNDLVKLGTQEGNASLFARQEVEELALTRMRELFALPEVEIVPARFAPATLPLVLMPDRDAELKQRMEQDEADKRIGSAVLGLARVFTARISAEFRARLYLNLSSPLLQAVLAQPNPRARHAAQLLLSTATLAANRDGLEIGLGVGGALEQLSESLTALLTTEPGSP